MSAVAKTTRGRFWVDPRFLIGLTLVAASVVGVYLVVADAEDSTAVYAARSSLAVGDRISAEDLVATSVRLGGADEFYLSPSQLPAGGLIVTRTVVAGELVPASALGTRAGASVTSVVLELRGALAATIGPGAVVDVWAARATDTAAFGPPTVLVGAASVVRVVDSGGIIADRGAQSVEILVPKSSVAAVLEAVMNEDAIAVVPVNTALGD